MFELQQTVIKDIADKDELEAYYENLKNPLISPWTPEQVEQLRKTGFMQREGKLLDGQYFSDIVRITPKFKSVAGLPGGNNVIIKP